MSYRRVIPRDLFNEGNLLKCYGQLYLNLERLGLHGWLRHDGSAFEIVMDESSGSLHVANVTFGVGDAVWNLERPLNARGAYPLYLSSGDSDEIEVFNEDGSFTEAMAHFLEDLEPAPPTGPDGIGFSAD
jgi:hypothetical protein